MAGIGHFVAIKERAGTGDRSEIGLPEGSVALVPGCGFLSSGTPPLLDGVSALLVSNGLLSFGPGLLSFGFPLLMLCPKQANRRAGDAGNQHYKDSGGGEYLALIAAN